MLIIFPLPCAAMIGMTACRCVPAADARGLAKMCVQQTLTTVCDRNCAHQHGCKSMLCQPGAATKAQHSTAAEVPT